MRMFENDGNQWHVKKINLDRNLVNKYMTQHNIKFEEFDDHLVMLYANFIVHVYGYTIENCIYVDAYSITDKTFANLAAVLDEKIELYLTTKLIDDLRDFKGRSIPSKIEMFEEVYSAISSDSVVKRRSFDDSNIVCDSKQIELKVRNEIKHKLIDEFQWNIDGESISFNNENANPFDAEILRTKCMYSHVFSISWKFKQELLTVFDDDNIVAGKYNSLLYAVPTTDYKKVLVLYRFNPDFQTPSNAVIYNADKTIFCHLERPTCLLSKMGKMHNMNIKNDRTLGYSECGWSYCNNNELILRIRIEFNKDWWEDRILDYNTGLLGDLLDEGRI